jgi:hypothetical protein
MIRFHALGNPAKGLPCEFPGKTYGPSQLAVLSKSTASGPSGRTLFSFFGVGQAEALTRHIHFGPAQLFDFAAPATP